MKRPIGPLLLTFTVFININELRASGHRYDPFRREALSTGHLAVRSGNQSGRSGYGADSTGHEDGSSGHGASSSGHVSSQSEHGDGQSGNKSGRTRQGAGSSGHRADPSGHGAGPSRQVSGPTGHEDGQSGHKSGPTRQGAGPSGHGGGSTGNRDSPSGHEAGPSEPELPEELRSHLTLPSSQPSNWNFYYRGKKVGVWLDSELKVFGIGFEEGNIIPDPDLRLKYMIISYLEYAAGNFFLVHALPDGYIAGVQSIQWNNFPRRVSRGATSTFIYQGRRIDVWRNRAGKAYTMRLQSRNIVPTALECALYDVQTNWAQYDDMRFLVHTLRSGYLVGVLLA